MELIKKIAQDLAKEISTRKTFDVIGVSTLIEITIEQNLKQIINQFIPELEKKYLDLLSKQRVFKVGSDSYNQIAYDISIVKAQKATANRFVNNTTREESLAEIKKFVVDKYGPSGLDGYKEK